MSTRCIITFVRNAQQDEPTARIYRHCDGYPSGVLPDLAAFFAAVQEQVPEDTRFDDASYLAAKYVVWQADQNATPRDWERREKKMLNFTMVGIVSKGDIGEEYEYRLTCDNDRTPPRVQWREAGKSEWREGPEPVEDDA